MYVCMSTQTIINQLLRSLDQLDSMQTTAMSIADDKNTDLDEAMDATNRALRYANEKAYIANVLRNQYGVSAIMFSL